MTTPIQPLALPSKPPTQGATKTGSQRDRRFTDTFFDNCKSARFPRGRPWTGEREYAATPELGHQPGFITSDLQRGEFFCENQTVGQTREERQQTLASAWNAPWIPYAKYFQFHYQRKLITFDLARNEGDEKQSLDKYYRAAAKLSGANGWGAVKFNEMPTYQVTSILGEPTIYLPIVQAARAGDPWLLGHIDEPNERLAKILGMDLLFTSEAAQRGGLAMQALPTEPQESKAVVTPDQVLSIPMDQLAATIMALMDARDKAKKDADKERMAKARAAKKSPPAEANV
jgi:hypothetical protein